MNRLRTLDLAVDFAKQCRALKVPLNLRDQLDRAATSIALNIAEGSAKSTPADRHRFYRIALGSFRETETLLEILDVNATTLVATKRKLGGSLTNLVKATV